MSLLAKVQRGRSPKPPRVLLYGVPEAGKSTFGSQAPNPVFVPTEDGLGEIDCARFPLATSVDQVAAALDELVHQAHEFESVVIDSLDWLERMIWDRVCDEFGVKNVEKADGGYGRGYQAASGTTANSSRRAASDRTATIPARGRRGGVRPHADPRRPPLRRGSHGWG